MLLFFIYVPKPGDYSARPCIISDNNDLILSVLLYPGVYKEFPYFLAFGLDVGHKSIPFFFYSTFLILKK
jgi:hypothetical protein